MKKTEKTEGFPGTDAKGQEGQTAAKPKRGRKPRAVKKQGAESVAEMAAGTETEPMAEMTAETETASAQESTAGTEGPSETDAGGQEKQAEAKPKRGRKPRAVKKQEVESVTEKAAETETESAQKSAVDTETESVEETIAETETAPEDTAGQSPALVPMAGRAEVAESPLKRMKQEFQQRAQVIKEQMRNIQNAFITIGFQLHWIRENNMFRVLNYRNVYEYAEKEYGIKKTTCCNFISIIENYADRDENGQVIESIADCYRNYSASQLVAMLGMTEEMKQQVTPDMSVRAISRLRKGEPGTSGTEAATVIAQEPAPAKDSGAESPLPEEDAPAYEEAEAAAMQEPDGTAETEGNPESSVPRGEGQEIPQAADGDTETDGGYAVEEERGPAGDNDGTLAEIDSYSDYRSMADELDLIMRHVFATTASVRVKIVCVQG